MVQLELLVLLLWCLLAMLQKLLNLGFTGIDYLVGKKFETPRPLKGTLLNAGSSIDSSEFFPRTPCQGYYLLIADVLM